MPVKDSDLIAHLKCNNATKISLLVNKDMHFSRCLLKIKHPAQIVDYCTGLEYSRSVGFFYN